MQVYPGSELSVADVEYLDGPVNHTELELKAVSLKRNSVADFFTVSVVNF